MRKEAKTVGQVVEELSRTMPRAVSHETLAEYGLEASREQAQRATLEALYVNLFWIFSACDDLLTKPEAARLQDELCRRVVSSWSAELHLEPGHQDLFARELDERHGEYAAVVRAGGNPGSVCVEAAGIMERNHVFPAEDRMKVVALLVDLAPVDAYADLLRDIQLVEG